MALGYIDSTGLHLPDYPAVLDDIKSRLRAIFGEDLYLEPDSQEGQLAAIFALAVHDAYSLAGSVYNAYSPSTAQGTGLSRMVIINGMRRQPSSYSTVGLRIVGEAGTVINDGQAEDNAGRRWLLPSSVSIPLGGEVLVTATAAEPGDLHAAAGEILKIATPCRGWQSVNNPLAAVAGAAVETDAALRSRQRVSTALPSRSVFEGTVGAVASLTGVTRWRGYENDTNAADANGIPAHTICMVVEGGDNQAIADAVAAKKTPGTGTMGDVVCTVRDMYGSPNIIRFYRPQRVRVRTAIVIQALPGYLSTTGARIMANVVKHINAIPIGDDVLLSRIYCPVNESDAPGARTFDVISVTLAADGGAAQAANVDIPYNGAAMCAAADVTLEVRA